LLAQESVKSSLFAALSSSEDHLFHFPDFIKITIEIFGKNQSLGKGEMDARTVR
jgi:hypothetical protein